ncbi:MAG: prephenate dehydratase [Planctomycetota bacterium]|nr:prephenate dehydratase [Planctomycetota bacterium]MCX8039487.1 prephenate dehydratase [Planctomycetota bacterium]MDW8373005.1 prephenate dehydratase [Planctomycetota bacterium]
MNDIQDLADIRARIDAIDARLVELLNQRAELARCIGRAKAEKGIPIFVPHREHEVFCRLAAINRGPLPDAALRGIWREIMSASFALERPLTICHFGQPGAFTHLAARLKFGSSVQYLAADAIAQVFAHVERGAADYGVVPIENSTDGTITDTIDAFLAGTVRIINELYVRIRHHLMAGVPLAAVRRVYSRATVFGQCRRWLAVHLPGVELVEVASTTRAAERAAAEAAEGSAAIGSEEAAQSVGLPIVASDIQDDPHNQTRFIVVARPQAAAEPTGDDKTSLMLAINDRPGALYEALGPFHDAGINLCKIESRPSRRRAWEYLFFIDFLGHARDPRVAATLAELARRCAICEVLGSYPRASAPLNS